MFKFLSLLIASVLVTSSVFAQEGVFTLKKQVTNTQEYFAGAYPGAVMMKVNLLGGVHKPGVYNVPVNTELNSVISYAGGPTKEAELNEILIRSKQGSSYKVKKVDLKQFFADPKETPYQLRPDDYVYVHQNEDFINNDVFRASMVVSAIVGALLSAVLIDRALEK
jgi:hypothetical protein